MDFNFKAHFDQDRQLGSGSTLNRHTYGANAEVRCVHVTLVFNGEKVCAEHRPKISHGMRAMTNLETQTTTTASFGLNHSLQPPTIDAQSRAQHP